MNDRLKTFIAFAKLGQFLRDFINNTPKETEWSNKLQDAIILAGHKNGWFTEENIKYTLGQWSELLTEDRLNEWFSKYDVEKNKLKKVALIMAGNIPLVGFHDFLAVLLTGNSVLIKLSSNDSVLLPFLSEYLIEVEPSIRNRIEFKKDQLKDFDVVIATGSNNTARYFEYYFGKVPNIIRKNRNSVAVLTGEESMEQLEALGEDIFRYYGLGCRSVSKLFVPQGYDFDPFFKAIYTYRDIIELKKYANNYDYNKAVYLMSEFKILDNGFLILKKDKSYASPIASSFYEEYASLSGLKQRLESDAQKIQCIVGAGIDDNEIAFGHTQRPRLTDYADGIDTVEFLLKT
ncbi:acyl-CoA reductase [Maribacter algicola]|uniref:Acyl-CoA reductase n=1 Tax=Meishania litoralis TaxID=3434685 RepID=A0ACC7LJJ3_9FLAO